MPEIKGGGFRKVWLERAAEGEVGQARYMILGDIEFVGLGSIFFF